MVRFAVTTLSPLTTRADVALPNGMRLHYAQQGPKAGPAIVLLHGYSDSSFSFSRVMPLLPAELRVIAPDLRGHGESDRPASGYRTRDLADDVMQMMDALSIPSAIVVGHSMGSFVAQAIADLAPGRLTGLVLLASAPNPAVESVIGMRDIVDALTDPVDEEFVRSFQYSTIAAEVPASFMDAAIVQSCRMPARIWKDVLHAMIEYRPAPRRPQVRTLVLGGKLDTVFSATEQMQLARQFSDGRLQLVDGVGHALHWEAPEVFVKALMRFIG